MRKEGHTLIFDYPGGQVTFDEDLKKWYQILRKCREQSDKLLAGLGNGTSPGRAFERTRQSAVDFIKADLLPSLAQYGIYNLTPEDFFTDNFAYSDLKKLAQDVSRQTNALEQKAALNADIRKKQAESEIVTGMGFGILSNRISDHVIYDMQSKSVASKQQMEYSRVANEIDIQVHRDLDKSIIQAHQNVAKERDILVRFCFEIIAAKYYVHLTDVGQIREGCLVGLDEGRSNELLKNLEFVPNKEGVIFQAIQLCPYNLNIYFQIYNMGIEFQPIYKEILEYSGAFDDFTVALFRSCNHTGASISELYRANEQKMRFLSSLTDSTLVDTARAILFSDFQQMFSLYHEVADAIKSNVLADTLKKRYKDTSSDEYWPRLSKELSAIREKCSAEEVSFLSTYCGIDVFTFLSVWFGKAVVSFDDVDGLIQAAWTSVKTGVEIEETEQCLAKCREQLKAMGGIGDIICYLGFGLPGLLVFLFILYFWLVEGYFDFFTFVMLLFTGAIACLLLFIPRDIKKKKELKRKIAQEEQHLKELQGQ